MLGLTRDIVRQVRCTPHMLFTSTATSLHIHRTALQDTLLAQDAGNHLAEALCKQRTPGTLNPSINVATAGDDSVKARLRAPGGHACKVDGGDAPHPAPPRHRVQGPAAAAAGARRHAATLVCHV
jgi:hypothetical protein